MDPNDAQKGVTIGGFYLTNDTWNDSYVSQVTSTMYICNYNSWYVIASMNNNDHSGAVKTYPNVHKDFSNPKVTSYTTMTSTYAENRAHNSNYIYEYAYDIWLNNYGIEIMIWTDNNGQTPGGSKQSGNLTSNGHTYSVYKSGSDYFAFVDSVNSTSGTVNLMDFFNYMTSKGWETSTATITQIDYGVELVSTNSEAARFDLTDFSLITQ